MGPGAIRYAEDSLMQPQDTRKMPNIQFAGVNMTGIFVLCRNLSGNQRLEAGTTVIHQVA